MAANKHLLLSLFFILNILGVSSQVDQKYLEGAVPLLDGKVVLTRDIKVNTLIAKGNLFKLANEWAEKEFASEAESTKRVLVSRENENYIVCQGDEMLVFKSAILMIDQAKILYQLVVRVNDDGCLLEMRNIRYEYQDYDYLVPAEEMITDKYALHKSGEKLNRHYDKFRTFTIDRLDELRDGLITYLAVVEELPKPAPSIQAEGSPAISIGQPVAVATDDSMTGYKQMASDQLSDGIMDMFKDSWALATIGQGNNTKTMPAAWSGLGNFGGKPVSMTIVNSGNNTDETYTISFYTPIHKAELDKLEKGEVANLTPITTPSGAKAFSEAWMIIECKKALEQSVTKSMIEDAQSKQWSKSNFDKLFMGEIINIWAR